MEHVDVPDPVKMYCVKDYVETMLRKAVVSDISIVGNERDY